MGPTLPSTEKPGINLKKDFINREIYVPGTELSFRSSWRTPVLVGSCWFLVATPVNFNLSTTYLVHRREEYGFPYFICLASEDFQCEKLGDPLFIKVGRPSPYLLCCR